MGGSIILKETSTGVRYLSIDFAGIHPSDDLQVKTIKFKKLDGSTYSYDYSSQGNLNITIDCTEVAYETELEFFYIKDQSAFEQGYHYGSNEFNLQSQEGYNPFPVLNPNMGAIPLEDFKDIYTICTPGLYIDGYNMRGIAYAKVDGMAT